MNKPATAQTGRGVANAPEKNLTGFKVFTPENLTPEDVKKYICEKATDKEIAYFLQVCAINNLNPFKKEVYLVKYGDNPASILTAYDVYLKRAERSKNYAGLRAWTEGEGDNMKGCVEIRRKDWDAPLYHEVDYKEYVQYRNLPNNGGKVPTTFWKDKPKTMIKKVVISQGLRLAFPDEIVGLPHTQEEAHVIDADARQVDAPGKPEITTTTAAQETTTDRAAGAEGEFITKADWENLVKEGAKKGWTEDTILDHAKATYKIEKPSQITKWDFDLLEQYVKNTQGKETVAK